MSTSSVVHHVELCKDPVSFTQEEKVLFDECSKELVGITSRGIFCTSLIGDKRGLRSFYNVQRPAILNAKFSPDHLFLAVQVNAVDIEFINLEDNTSYVQSFKTKKKGTILNFFWTYPDNFVVILTGSIDLFQFPKPPKSKDGMKLLNDQKITAACCHYSADNRHRIVLISPPPYFAPAPFLSLSSSPPTAGLLSIYTFYFRHNKIIKIPRFDIESDGTALTPPELVIYQLYDAIYVIHVNSKRKELVLYQVTKEAVIRRTRLDLLTAGTSNIHIVDNLILVHNKTSRVTMMFDIKSRKDMERFPVASPLPISAIPFEPNLDANLFAPHQQAPPRALPHTTSLNPLLYSESWKFHLPCFIVSQNAGMCWHVGLNLDGIIQSLTNDRCRMTEFLLRRTIPQTKKVILRELLAMVVEHESLAVTAQVFDSINGVLAARLRDGVLEAASHVHPHANRSSLPPSLTRSMSWTTLADKEKPDTEPNHAPDGEWIPEQAETLEATDPDEVSISTAFISASPPSLPNSYTQPQPHQPIPPPSSPLHGDSVVVTQADMYTHVFMPIEGRDPPLLDSKYVVGVLTEYVRSLNFHHISVTPFLYELLINFLVSTNRWYQLHQFLQYHVVSDSTHVACQLLSLESKYPPAYQIALDMLKRLNTHEQIVEVLISKNMLMHALRFMKSHRVKIPPKRVLEAAVQMQDYNPTIFFHVYKFFETRRELTEDCDKYVHLARKLFGEEKVRIM